LGDRFDGLGEYLLNGSAVRNETSNEVYAFCMSYPEISFNRLELMAQQSKYNCLVTIIKPEMLFNRIRSHFVSNSAGCHVHCGAAIYDRGKEVSKLELNFQKYNFNVFQKSNRFVDDKEYRLPVVTNTVIKSNDNFIYIELGDCSDIIEINNL